MKAVIIEDEKHNLVLLRKLLNEHCKQVRIVAEAHNAEQGAAAILEYNPDLVFLDIQLPRKTGFDMLESLGEYDFDVIFVTGFDQYAIRAIRCSALDYLVKPVAPADLVKAVRKAQVKRSRNHSQAQVDNMLTLLNRNSDKEPRIGLQLAKEVRLVNPADIIRCESDNSYTRFYLSSGEKLVVTKGLFSFEAILDGFDFIRCHQSHLVNRKYIHSLRREHAINELVLTNGARLPVSRLKLDLIREKLKLKG